MYALIELFCRFIHFWFFFGLLKSRIFLNSVAFHRFAWLMALSEIFACFFFFPLFRSHFFRLFCLILRLQFIAWCTQRLMLSRLQSLIGEFQIFDIGSLASSFSLSHNFSLKPKCLHYECTRSDVYNCQTVRIYLTFYQRFISFINTLERSRSVLFSKCKQKLLFIAVALKIGFLFLFLFCLSKNIYFSFVLHEFGGLALSYFWLLYYGSFNSIVRDARFIALPASYCAVSFELQRAGGNDKNTKTK